MKLRIVGLGILVALMASVPAETYAVFAGESGTFCNQGYVVVDGVSYPSGRVCWTTYSEQYAAGAGTMSDPLNWLDTAGSWWDRFTSASIGNYPNDIPATSYSTESQRWSHAVKDAAQWIALHSNKSLKTQSVTVTYDDGGRETWHLRHMGDILVTVPDAGTLTHP